MTTSLVTGARGFVGGWLARALLERGDTVVSFDRRRVTEKPSAVGMLGIEDDLVQVEGDLCDAAELERVLADNEVDTVFHLAAETIVSTVQESPVQGFESNVRGTWTLLQACLEHGVERVVFASSDKAYGAHETLPYREDFPLQPTAPYEASKAAADLIARSYWHSYGLPIAVTRFANIYGGGDLNFSRLIPEAVSAALDGRAPGSSLRRVARARLPLRRGRRHRLSGDRRRARPRRRARRGVQRGRRALLSGARRDRDDHASSPARAWSPTSAAPGNPDGEIDKQYVDPTKLRETLGWEPEVGLEDGLERTLDWYRDHPESWAPAPDA